MIYSFGNWIIFICYQRVTNFSHSICFRTHLSFTRILFFSTLIYLINVRIFYMIVGKFKMFKSYYRKKFPILIIINKKIENEITRIIIRFIKVKKKFGLKNLIKIKMMTANMSKKINYIISSVDIFSKFIHELLSKLILHQRVFF